MAFFEKNKDKISSKYTLKRTKMHRFKNFSRGNMPPNPPSNAHGDMQIPKSEKKILGPPPPKSWGRPCKLSYLVIVLMGHTIVVNNQFHFLSLDLIPRWLTRDIG